ncbi:hypothetical protein [Paenibacillus bovis]|uniref:Uncharacterized protein n=1 Tax=Paenibacillus bovis TaxID=1616788 RepID=A0A172ZF01_9BACL|nr:hypothetical protein [Paenibacillus bovis]ANF96215.1 hypothetical protein AR543_09525 [Paenibacillus bovis]
MSNLPQDNYPPGQPGYNTGVVSFKEWMITMLLVAIPVVNLVMLFIWAFGGNAKLSKSNYAKATLIWMVIGIVVSIIFSVLFGAAIAGLSQYSTGTSY